MNGPHDLGGQMGFGPLPIEADEPLFHADWEARAMGVVLACGALGHWTIDESRHARECLPPAIYYASSYYEIWTRALEVLLQRHGLLVPDEIVAGHGTTAQAHPKRLAPEAVAAALAKGSPCDRPLERAPRFAPGERVRTRNIHPTTHTRLPRYLRGHSGVIEADCGGYVFPDANAHGKGEQPGRLYTVVFDGADIWGEGAEPGLTISADLWESYLEHA